MENFPLLREETPEEVVVVLKRMIQQRDDDIAEVDTLQEQAGYDKGFKRSTLPTSASISIGETDVFVDGTGGVGGITITLDDNAIDGQTHWIHKADAGAGAVTIDGGAKNINGAGTLVLANQFDSARLTFMGAADEWRAAT